MNTAQVRQYIKDAGSTVKINQRTNLTFVNLDITHRCNLHCHACNRYMDSAPSGKSMTLDQVRRFVDEAIETAWPFVELRICGGEPTLHPDFSAICKEVQRLRQHLPKLHVKVISNGIGKRVVEALRRVPAEFAIRTSTPLKLTSTPAEVYGQTVALIPEFGNVLIAPCDREDVAEISDCQIHATCGLELTRFGYLPCGCGGARVIGMDIFFKRLADVTPEACRERLEVLCGICGRNLHHNTLCKDSTEVSPFWTRVLGDYAEHEPELELY